MFYSPVNPLHSFEVVLFMNISRPLVSLAVSSFLILAGCATSSTVENGYDPAEYLNRPVHSLNKGIDKVLIRPIAKGYEAIVPATIKHVIGNEVRFLSLPGTLINSALQGNIERTGDTAARLFVNATMGGLGALDPATDMNIPEHSEDFGQTLAVWGARQGPYYSLPLLGPSTARGVVGRVGDFALDPLSFIGGGSTRLWLGPVNRVASIIDTRMKFGSAIDQALYNSPDSYVTVRNLYLQRRRNAILNGQDSPSVRPDIYEGGEF